MNTVRIEVARAPVRSTEFYARLEGDITSLECSDSIEGAVVQVISKRKTELGLSAEDIKDARDWQKWGDQSISPMTILRHLIELMAKHERKVEIMFLTTEIHRSH